MNYSPELARAARKYYEYCHKHDKARSTQSRSFFWQKREHYRLLVAELFRREFRF